jgi:type I restriction enzyme S subunit
MAGAGQAKYPPYPAYKPSGVEWLGDIPESWGNAPLKYMALEQKSLFLDGDWIESKDLSDDGIRYITTGNVGEGAYKEQGGGYISEETFKKINASEVFEGDILVSRLNAPIGRACIVPDLSNRIVTSVDNVIFRPDAKFLRVFVVYMLSSREYFAHTSNMARGATMQRISRGLLGNVRIVFPSRTEQTKIAAFLDHETVKIDALIAKQQWLIALLEEKRQAVIRHAVTKGLDKAAPLRASGIDWLGDVPEHWEVKPLKYLCTFSGGGTPSKDVISFWSKGTVPWVSPKDMKSFYVSETQDKITPAAVENSSTNYVEAGALLMVVRSGILQRAIPIAINQKQVTLNQDMKAIRFNAEVVTEYAANYILGHQRELLLEWSKEGATVESIEQEYLSQHLFPVPPLTEQQEICEFLDQKKSTFVALTDKSKSAIALLKERRTALISAAVTGKIDLRDWRLPEGASHISTQKIAQIEEALA